MLCTVRVLHRVYTYCFSLCTRTVLDCVLQLCVHNCLYTTTLLSAFHTAKWHSLHRLQTERILGSLTISVWREVVEIENCRMFSSVNRPCWRARRTQRKGGIFSLHHFYQILRLELIGVETILCYSYRRTRTRRKASRVIGKWLFLPIRAGFLHLNYLNCLKLCIGQTSFFIFVYFHVYSLIFSIICL